jgi:beta-N-acetylhexosaminidase
MRVFLNLLLAAAVGAVQVGTAATGALRPLEQAAGDLMERMSPEQRIGQLVLVTMRGPSLTAANPILDLLANHAISGVVLQASNDNFSDSPNTLTDAAALISELQQAAYQASLPATPGPVGATQAPEQVYVPLFIGISQEGNGAPFSQIRTGLSQLPSAMAIGATWDAGVARAAGELMGRELEALGFNLLLGPSLDVLLDPSQIGQGDLGVRTFGGDPYWAGVMGGAFIEGLHSGSGGRLGVVVKHFPGLGGSDRPIEEEVSTVRKSLVQLQQIELAPFIAVTGAAPGSRAGIADGLLVGQIRYQGFQGNIRDTTRPIGFDPDAFSQLMAVEPFANWQQGGGVTVSGALGARAVRRFYESLGQGYRGQLVARDAFLAGNDLLYLSTNFRSDTDPDPEATIRATLAFFAQKYRDDPVFAERVDQSVQRILELKLRLYGGIFELERVIPPEERMEAVGLGAQFSLDVARRAATLLSPAAEEVPTLLGGPPRIGERVVFITDVRIDQQCSTCQAAQVIGRTAMEDTVKRLYGTSAAGQVGAWNLTSLSMADVAVSLGKSPPSAPGYPIQAAEQTEEALRQADWLVFLILKSDPAVFGSDALKQLLDQRPELVRDTKVVVFALDVPYELDATEISKIDVYYALYGKTSPFIEVAARLLFQELSPVGSSPISVPGIGYDLILATSPDPDQLISLAIAGRDEVGPPGYVVGDVVEVSTGVLVDSNGHPVPDGTPVEFILGYQGDPATFSMEGTTAAGVAIAPVTLDRLGVLTIQAESEPARTSQILQLNIQEGVVTVIAPTPEPSDTPEPTQTPPQETVTPESAEQPPATPPEGRAGAGAAYLGLGIVGVGLVASAGYFATGAAPGSARSRRLLLIVIGGLALYDYAAVNLPGSAALLQAWGPWGGLVLGAAGGLLGWGAWWLWARLAERTDGGH